MCVYATRGTQPQVQGLDRDADKNFVKGVVGQLRWSVTSIAIDLHVLHFGRRNLLVTPESYRASGLEKAAAQQESRTHDGRRGPRRRGMVRRNGALKRPMMVRIRRHGISRGRYS